MSMDRTVKRIVEMLAEEQPEVRLSAAVVLGELGVKDPAALAALGECLEPGDPALRRAALAALAVSKTAKVAAMLVPLLDDPDPGLRQAAAAQLAAHGKAAINTLCKALGPETPAGRRKAVISLLAPRHDARVTARLLSLLSDREVGDHTLWAVREELDAMGAAALEAVRDGLRAMIKDRAVMDDPMAAARTVRLLGEEPSSKLVRTLLPFTREAHPLPLRLAALAALRRPLGAARSTGEAFKALAALAAGEAEPTLVRAALDTLSGLEPGAGAAESLTALAESSHAEARAFALRTLGKSGGEKVHRRLLDHLSGDDPAARRAAGEGLAAMDDAGPALVAELGRCGDEAHLFTLCRTLRPHVDALSEEDRAALAGHAVALLERCPSQSEPLLRLAAGKVPDTYAAALYARSKTHLKASRHAEALVLLERLDRLGRLDDSGRLSALKASLVTRSSVKSLARADRANDPSLRHLTALVTAGFPAARRLIKDKAVDKEALFYLGFNYSESLDELEQELGAELLEHLAEASPRSKLGRSARNKLRLTGLSE